MSTVKTEYIGALKTSTNYALSETPILTKVGTFEPTDLLTTSLGGCIVTYIDFVAKRNNFTTNTSEIEVIKTLKADKMVVDSFDIIINFNSSFTDEQKQIIENAAKNCPVGNSLHPDIKRTYVFNY